LKPNRINTFCGLGLQQPSSPISFPRFVQDRGCIDRGSSARECGAIRSRPGHRSEWLSPGRESRHRLWPDRSIRRSSRYASSRRSVAPEGAMRPRPSRARQTQRMDTSVEKSVGDEMRTVELGRGCARSDDWERARSGGWGGGVGLVRRHRKTGSDTSPLTPPPAPIRKFNALVQHIGLLRSAAHSIADSMYSIAVQISMTRIRPS